jgi:hypothetical protein
MHTLTTLYFPETAIYSPRQFPLFLLFRHLHLLKPAEYNEVKVPHTVLDIFIKSGLCQVHTPVPLGEDSARFARLVHDIENRRDDYAAQLNSLTLAALSEKKGLSDESEAAIMSSLHGRSTKGSLQATAQERLWPARLVLAIGELLDREEEEVAQQLAAIEDEESDLFRAIRGELGEDGEENPFGELTRLANKLGTGHGGNMRKRFAAWRTLLLAGESPAPHILLTSSREVADLLLEEYERQTGAPSPLTATYTLPGFIDWNPEEAIRQIRSFGEKHGAILTEIAACQTQLATMGSPPANESSGRELQLLCTRWNELIAKEYPAQRSGRLTVQCYLVPGITNLALLGKEPSVKPSANGILMVAG